MRKQLILSVIAVTAAVSFVTHANAAGAVRATSMKERMTEYSNTVKEALFGSSRSAKGLEAQKAKSIQDKFVAKLGLDAQSNNLALALADGAKSAQRYEALASVVAVKTMAIEVSKKDAVEGKSMADSADAMAKFIANSALIGAKKTSKELDATALADVTVALDKVETLSEVVITKFDKADRDSWTQIISRYNEINEQGGGKSAEEAMLTAVMDVKKVNKEQALEILRKLKECV